jgi:hypothetical protein
MTTFRTIKRVAVVILAAQFLLQGSVIASVKSIWAVNDGEKVERDDLNNANKQSNSAWDGKTIKIFGARNELLAFQVIVEAGADGIKRLSASLNELRQPNGRERITYRTPIADPTNYVRREIQLFSANYMNVEVASHADWVFKPGSAAAPKDATGLKPVQLVPENAKVGKGGFPLTVAPQQNQAIWIEIYLRKNLSAGVYRGLLNIDADGLKQIIPVELELFDFVLPDRNSMDAMIYYEGTQPVMYQGRNLDAEYNRFAHRQRVELVHAFDIESVNAVKGRFTGQDFTERLGYEGPGTGVGNRVIPRTFYGPGKDFDERASAWQKSDQWMTFINSNFPDAVTFLYMPDEPGRSEYEYIRKLAENIHSNPGPGKALPTFVTKRYVKELDGAINYWDTGPLGYDIERAEQERARGRKYWIYNGGRPAAGAIVIDAPATDPRATIWACFKHDIDNYFFWHGVHWQHNRQKVGERRQNVWANPITFDNRGQPNKPLDDQGYINGDGVLIYPGEDKLHPDQDRGIAGPINTIQLANLRRGLQDHLYLTIARGLGLNSIVNEEIKAVVPRVFSDAKGVVGFAESGSEYERARYRLAKAISQNQNRKK